MKKQSVAIQLTKEQKANVLSKIKAYMADNFEIEIGNLQAEIFFEFITNSMGIYYYNKGIADSFSFMSEKAEDLYLLMKNERD